MLGFHGSKIPYIRDCFDPYPFYTFPRGVATGKVLFRIFRYLSQCLAYLLTADFDRDGKPDVIEYLEGDHKGF